MAERPLPPCHQPQTSTPKAGPCWPPAFPSVCHFRTFSHKHGFLSLLFPGLPSASMPPNQGGRDFQVLSSYSDLGTFIKTLLYFSKLSCTASLHSNGKGTETQRGCVTRPPHLPCLLGREGLQGPLQDTLYPLPKTQLWLRHGGRGVGNTWSCREARSLQGSLSLTP